MTSAYRVVHNKNVMRQAWKSEIIAHAVQFNAEGRGAGDSSAGVLRIAQFSLALLEIMPRGCDALALLEIMPRGCDALRGVKFMLEA